MSNKPNPVSLQRDAKRPRRSGRGSLIIIAVVVIVLLLIGGGIYLFLFGDRVSEALEPEPTLPPAAEVEGQSDDGILYEADFDDD
ncbi:MAG: hypothetical protein GYB68_05290, partial [Chloroflexi bacterium]|nr:hypothetical protein [Chloroflexota bacterium]